MPLVKVVYSLSGYVDGAEEANVRRLNGSPPTLRRVLASDEYQPDGRH
jgi:hypothetical protein